MENQELIPHLFRTEFRKITSVLCKHFGLDYLEVAEDIVGETFLSALETWPYKGIPENPTAWLYTVAKNKTLNHLQREKVFHKKVVGEVKGNFPKILELEIDLSDTNIVDSQLQMLFAICHPMISREAQIGLALKILCGFGIEEIANAFLTNKEVINKRLFRAKEKIRDEKIQLEFPSEKEIEKRLEIVLTTLYLLFNEGYYSESNDQIVRKELCLEAIRLTYLLAENEKTNRPNVNALLALMCFHTSRFEARMDEKGEIVLYQDQNESLWNQELIGKGAFFLSKASVGETFSKYHVEATIAYWSTHKSDTKEKWETILQLYNRLLQLEYSPMAALNRTFALSKANGKKEAIVEAEKLQLKNNPYYYSLLGELYKDMDNQKAKECFEKAFTMAKTQTEKRLLQHKINNFSMPGEE